MRKSAIANADGFAEEQRPLADEWVAARAYGTTGCAGSGQREKDEERGEDEAEGSMHRCNRNQENYSRAIGARYWILVAAFPTSQKRDVGNAAY